MQNYLGKEKLEKQGEERKVVIESLIDRREKRGALGVL